MKALRLSSPGNLEIKKNIPKPRVGPNSILLKVHYCGICSSDIKFIDKAHRVKKYPLTLGHEIAGTIAQIGKNIKNYKIDDKIVLGAEIPCNRCFYCKTNRNDFCEKQTSVGTIIDGGFAEYFLLNSNFIKNGPIIKLLKNADLSLAFLSESVACVLNGIEISKKNNFHSVLILGCGYMGLVFGYIFSKLYKKTNTVIVDNNIERLSIAKKNGIKNALEINFKNKNIYKKIINKNNNYKFDFVISANNNLISHKMALDFVSRGGCVNFFGGIPKNINDKLNISANKIHYDQINITGSFSSNKIQLNKAYKFIINNETFFRSILSKPVAISKAIEYFNLVRTNKVIKAAIKF